MDRRRRTMTLWEQLTSAPDPAIRDVLKVPHDDDAERRPYTLVDAIGRESRGESAGGGMITLMDAIGRDVRGQSGAGMIRWKPLRDRLRLRRAATAPSTATGSRRGDDDDNEEEDEAPAAASTSLMALLEQPDSQWEDDDEEDEDGCGSGPTSSAMAGDEDEENGEGREEEEEEMVRACCVCTVRHKGAAFIPCGHTFCRLCSRELWLTRASCPLCNAFIHDILHIF